MGGERRVFEIEPVELLACRKLGISVGRPGQVGQVVRLDRLGAGVLDLESGLVDEGGGCGGTVGCSITDDRLVRGLCLGVTQLVLESDSGLASGGDLLARRETPFLAWR